tara:strand:+ start:1318 stop:1773 length:456 start_codon:yes stop_codon:yes gene_type:complete
MKLKRKKKMNKVLIINGPNLNLLGQREQNIYGKKTMEDIEEECKIEGEKYNLKINFFQSNSESEIIDMIQKSSIYKSLIINAGAFTHTSIAIHDALKILKIPIIEVHISNIYQREDFRKNSFVSSVANGIIVGFGTDVYLIAIRSINNLLK